MYLLQSTVHCAIECASVLFIVERVIITALLHGELMRPKSKRAGATTKKQNGHCLTNLCMSPPSSYLECLQSQEEEKQQKRLIFLTSTRSIVFSDYLNERCCLPTGETYHVLELPVFLHSEMYLSLILLDCGFWYTPACNCYELDRAHPNTEDSGGFLRYSLREGLPYYCSQKLHSQLI